MVARFGGLEVTIAELDARILSLPPAERPQPGQDLDAWYENQIRELVVEHRLRAEAVDRGLGDSEEILEAEHEIEKQLAVQLCLVDVRPDLGSISEDEVRAAYDKQSVQLSAPERRSVFHLFLRQTPDRSADEARRQVSALRDRALAGESFQRLAATESDSEDRHRQGLLGWISRGQLPAGFENVIFALEEGVPSEPVVTRDGVHLFFVDQILPARQTSYGEVRQALFNRLAAERQQAALREIEAEIELPPDSVVLDRKAFNAVVQSGDPEAIVLEIGEVSISLAELRRKVRQASAQQTSAGHADDVPPGQLAWQVLENLRHRELLYSHCRSEGKIPRDELDERLETWRRQALLVVQRQKRLRDLAARDETRLRQYYESNLGVFSKSPEWQLRRLRIPLDERAKAVMARLESAASRSVSATSEPGAGGLEGLRDELGGEIDDLGMKTLRDLGALDPRLPALVSPLTEGQLSAPYRSTTALELVEVVARRDAEPMPFEEARDRVAASYVEQYTREIYRELSEEILKSAKLEIFPEGLAAARDLGISRLQPTLESAPDEVSVEDLEKLLDEL